jgi:hypothetical protein
MIKPILRAEGLVVFVVCLFWYSNLNASWLLFILLWLVPDISMVGYLKDTKLGAIIYNLVHNYILALVVCAFGIFFGNNLIVSIGVIWVSHIGLDRFMGYGLKYPDSFKHTHIQQL